MKKLKILVNNKKYMICFSYSEDEDKLIINIVDEKGRKLKKRHAQLIINELLKGFFLEKEDRPLKICKKEGNPITLYVDGNNVLVPSLFYKNNEFDDMEEIPLTVKKIKREKIINISTRVALYMLFLTLLINFCQDKLKEKEFNYNVKASYQTVYDEFDEDYFLKMFCQNPNFDDDDKLYFSSNPFFQDLARTNMTLEQRALIAYKLKTTSIEEYNLIQKGIYNLSTSISDKGIFGFVYSGEHRKDKIHLYHHNTLFSTYTLMHELVHVIQFDNEYKYLIEASAEILAHDYWEREIISYHNAVKRIYALIIIIGPEAIWNANFSSTEQLESEIRKYLSPEEAERLLNCLKVGPDNQKFDKTTGIGDVDKEIDCLLKIMFEKKNNAPFEEDSTIQAIYNMTKDGDFVYHVEGNTCTSPVYFFNSEKLCKPYELDIQKKKVK